MRERRQFPRLDTRLPLHYGLLPSGRKQPAVSSSLGGGGLCVMAAAHIEPETRLWIELQLPGRAAPVTFIGEVVWSEQYDIKGLRPVEIGVRFVEIAPDDLHAVLQHVDRNTPPGS